MNGAPTDRGTSLLLAHVQSLDPGSVTARERLDAALGPELATKLVGALCSHPSSREGSRLGARTVFAA